MTSSRHVFEPHSYMKLAAVFTQQYTRLPSRRNTEGFPPPSEDIRPAGSIRDAKPHTMGSLVGFYELLAHKVCAVTHGTVLQRTDQEILRALREIGRDR